MSKMILNPDQKIVEVIKNRLKLTKGHCPCIPQKDWNENTICPCKEFRENNICHCSLYVKINDDSN